MNKQNNKWDTLVKYISKQFGDGEMLDLQAILFLIGINGFGKTSVKGLSLVPLPPAIITTSKFFL